MTRGEQCATPDVASQKCLRREAAVVARGLVYLSFTICISAPIARKKPCISVWGCHARAQRRRVHVAARRPVVAGGGLLPRSGVPAHVPAPLRELRTNSNNARLRVSRDGTRGGSGANEGELDMLRLKFVTAETSPP